MALAFHKSDVLDSSSRGDQGAVFNGEDRILHAIDNEQTAGRAIKNMAVVFETESGFWATADELFNCFKSEFKSYCISQRERIFLEKRSTST